MPRMNIFNSLEQEAFECPPLFNHVERLNFFFAPLMFSDFMETMRTPTNKVCFIVAAGYFKARRKFFARQFHQADIEFVAAQIGLDPSEISPKSYIKVSTLMVAMTSPLCLQELRNRAEPSWYPKQKSETTSGSSPTSSIPKVTKWDFTL